MAAILQKQNDFTNAQVYIQKPIASAPTDQKDKLNDLAQTIAASAAQGAPAPSGGMSPRSPDQIRWVDGACRGCGQGDD